MIARELAKRLSKWNTVCTVAENPVYEAWLLQHFGHWKHARDFSKLSVETVEIDGRRMLIRDGHFYLYWLSPSEAMSAPADFIEAGLLMVGSSIGGDMMAIDTLAAEDFTVGFVDHEKLWGEECPPRDAYGASTDDLSTFLDKLDADPNFVFF